MKNTKRIIEICCGNSGIAEIKVKEQKSETVKTVFHTCGIFGENGVTADKREGDGKTPLGTFGIITAFGIKPKPETELDYIRITDTVYCSSDRKYYNRIIDSALTGYTPFKGEKMSEYVPEYDYGIFPDYNKEGIYGKGSAVFIHCFGKKTYTSGCVAVSKTDMLRLLSLSNGDTVIEILKKEE